MQDIPLMVVVGPTAVGKTSISINIAKKIDGEIVSADSMQVYKYMDIGTAKPSIEEMSGIPHYLIDVAMPDEEFNVAMFQQLASCKIAQIYSRGKIPILVGGSGLYVNSIVYPMDFTDATEDKEFRSKLQMELQEGGSISLYKKLKDIDSATANKLHPNDTKRVIRALEVYHITGKPMSQYKQDLAQTPIPYKLCMIGLNMERQKLYDNINIRVDNMLKDGLIDEVKNLLNMGYTKELISMQGLGYKEIIEYLEGRCSLNDAIYIIKRDTRRFAKRQFTWFRRDKRIHWVDIDKFGSKDELLDYLILHIKKKISSN